MKDNIGLVPLRNFAKLDNKLYRSAQPDYRHEYQWMRDVLGIKSMFRLHRKKEWETQTFEQNQNMPVSGY